MLLLALITSVVVCSPGRAAAANGQNAPLASTPVVTYNMDGANSADSKWTTTIGPLIARAQIVLLQEAGSGPPGARAEANQVFHNVPGAGIGDAGVVRHHRWQHDGDFSEVYFLQTDRNNGTYVGNRVNLAIVTHDDADEVTVLRNPQTNSRPLLGVRFGQNWYFTYHAQALGPDAWHVAMGEGEDVLQAAQAFVTGRGRGETWFVGGDFNVQPAEGAAGDRYAMRMPTVDPNSGRTATMYQPHFQPTHQSGRTLDYGVGSESVPNLPVTVPFGRTSDHFVVAIGALRAAAEPRVLYDDSPRAIENMHSGGVIESSNPNLPPGTMATARRTGDPSQLWKLRSFDNGTFEIQRSDSPTCMVAPQTGANRDSVATEPCLGPISGDLAHQQWELRTFGNEQYEFYSPYRDRCLGNGSSEDRITTSLPLEQCNGSDGQRWLLTPSTHPSTDSGSTALDPTDMSHQFFSGALESTEWGLLLQTPSLSSTDVRATQRKTSNATQHSWTFDWVAPTVVKLTDPQGSRCVQDNGSGPPSFSACSLRADQEWTVVTLGENEFMLVQGSGGSETCLSLLNSSDTDVAVVTDPCSANADAMRWFFAPADTSAPDPDAEEPGSGGGSTLTKRVMVVGDSISEGFEGDYTWRYRLEQSLAAANANVEFVGPYTGTRDQEDPGPIPGPPPPTVDQPAPAPEGPRTDGGYRDQLSFNSAHYAVWGRQAAQDADTIEGVVAQYQPTMLLVELGFNDLGWFISGPQGTLDSIDRLITNARAADPNISIALANVPHRTPLGGREDLPGLITDYDALLAKNVGSMSTATSKVALVDLDGNYHPDTDVYDGLHPNALGEYHIAQAFEATLQKSFGIGTGAETVPSSIPSFSLDTPTEVSATPNGGGIEVKWNRVYGASGYDLEQRNVSLGTDWQHSSVPTDDTEVQWLLDKNQYQFRVAAIRGQYPQSAYTPAISATTDLKLAAGPSGIGTRPDGDTSIHVQWHPPTGNYTDTVTEYGVLYWDTSVPGAYLQTQWVKGLDAELTGLVKGHTYEIFVESWNLAGTGLPAGARSVVVGAGIPAAPTLTGVTTTTPTDVQLTWTAVPGATGYRVWFRDAVAGNELTAGDILDGTSTGVAYLYPGAQRFEFCVAALNGNLESPRSGCQRAPAPPASTSSTPLTPTGMSATTAGTPTRAGSDDPTLSGSTVLDPGQAVAILQAVPTAPSATTSTADAALPLRRGR